MDTDLAAPETLTSEAEPLLGNVLASTLANKAGLDFEETVRDVVALLARFRVGQPEAAAAAIASARQALAGDEPALQRLEDVERKSAVGDPDLLPFGPVHHTDIGAVERLAFLTQLGFSSADLLFLFAQGTADFVQLSGGGTPAVVHIAALVQARLGASTLAALRWRDEVIPHLLQSSFELIELVAAGAGGVLVAEWQEFEAFLAPWVRSRRTLRSDPDGGVSDDGFLTGDRPGAIHPLVLRILRPKVTAMLESNDTDVVDEATSFNAFLADAAVAGDAAVAASPDLFPPAAMPGAALVAGAFILASARVRGVTLDGDGAVQSSAAAEPWTSLAERVLNALIFGAESDMQSLPPAWQDKVHLKRLFAACPDWGPAAAGTPLRARAHRRLQATFATLGQVLSAQAAALPSFAGATDRFAAGPVATRGSVVAEVDRALDALKTITAVSKAAAHARNRFECQLASPIAEPTLDRLLAAPARTNAAIDVMDGSIATYLTAKIAGLTPDSLAEALDGAGAWAASVNQQASRTADLPLTWVSLELWDGLRGRLIKPADSGDPILADTLARRLPAWLRGLETDPFPPDVAEIDVDQLRPALAAVAHVGMPAEAVSDRPDHLVFTGLRARLESLLDLGSPLKPDARRLITAAWIELTLSFVAASSGEMTLNRVFRDFEDLDRFAQRGVSALESKVAWEARAGMNALILLSRLADVTGAPLTALRLEQVFIFTPDVSELVASSVVRLLSPAPTGGVAVSALPLALVAADLGRFARESAQALGKSPTRPPAWISSPQFSAVRNQMSLLIGKLVARFADPSASPLQAFAWQGGRAGRALLLSIFQIELNRFSRARHFGVHPLGADDAALRSLQGLEKVARGVFCGERVLLAGMAAIPDARLVPWWSLGYWSAPAGQAPPAAGAPADRTLMLENWAAASTVDIDAYQLQLGAALESAVPVVRPGEEQDVDGLSNFALPDLSFQAALRKMTVATDGMKEAEVDYVQALTHEAELAEGFEILSMLKKPLMLDTADAAEQVQAADAAVREAEADLDAARHESVASEFEAASIEMLFQASEVEVKRQQVMTSITELEVTARELNRQAQEKEREIAEGGVDVAKLMLDKAAIIKQQADLKLQMATDFRGLVLKQIAVLNLLLSNEIVVTLPDGSQHPVPGQIAAMALKLQFSLKKKLADDQADAEAKLQHEIDEEERRRELERQSSFIKGILSFAGAVVGFVVGGPAGASLGSSIMGAAGDLVNGIVEQKPFEDIMVDLLGDALTVAKAAGVNLDALLSQVGSIAGKDAEQLFKNFEASITPILDNLPGVLDESLVRDAFKDVDFNRLVESNPFGDQAIKDLVKSSEPLGDLKEVLRQAGVANPIALGDPAAFRQNLAKQIFERLRVDPAACEAVRKVVGMSELTNEPQMREAADRLSKLVVTRLGLGATNYKSAVLSKWMAAKKNAHQGWNDVSDEGNALLAQLFPDARARSEMQANVRMALLDPESFQGAVQSFLTPWQNELDKRIAAVKEAGEAVLRNTKPTTAVEAARVRLDFILASKEKFGLNGDRPARGSLLAFLQGDSPQRAELFDQLQKQKESDEKEKNEIDVADFTVDVTKIDVAAAKKQIEKANDYLEKTGALLEKSKIEVQQATLMTTVNRLAEQHAEDTSAAQEKASQSAAEKVKASAARIEAAKATLDGRRAQHAGAKLRAVEAGRIRQSLGQPPLRLPAEDAIAGTIAFARVQHAEALDRGLRASREILRLLRAAHIPESDWPRPDASIGDPLVTPTPWSVSLAAQARHFTELFQKASAPSIDFDTIHVPLGLSQFQALQSPGGLKLRLRPGVSEFNGDDTIQQNIVDASGRSGRVIAVLLAGHVRTSGVLVPMTGQHYHASAEYRGDRWVSDTELHFVNVQQLKASRVSLMPPKFNADPGEFVNQQSELRDTQGDPKFNDVQGTPTSGTTVVRLVNVNPRPPLPGVPIEDLALTVLHSFFE